ncbi:nucleoside triphosphate pyrophosphohydrolase [Peribacillus sp. SCS-155]|uniref:nucleoside triphosphate pyrophosphohydrolase n=1 Tax=Peribacillus sedimenti TaxID=3115297 RepID=UPI003905F0F3
MTHIINVIGLGAGDLDQLPLGIYKKLKQAQNCFVRTIDHPVISELVKEGITFTSFDSTYEKHDSFEKVYEEIAESLLKEANHGPVIYAVPGHPMVAEKTVQLLINNDKGIKVKVEGGQSFLDALFTALKIDPIDGFQLLDATALSRDEIQTTQHIIIGQIYDAFIASEVKLTLLERLPAEHDVYLVTAAGSEDEAIKKLPLFELDRQMSEISNLTSLYIPPLKEEEYRYKEFSKLREIIAELRGPGGCPWDKKQTHESLKPFLIEEAYELIDAIDEADDEGMIGELGDVLLQVMLHSQIAEDQGIFTIDDVIEGITSKMIRRHPHVFENAAADTAEDVKVNWQKIKDMENAGKPKKESLLDEVGKSLPALIRAYEIQKRAAKVGFDWTDVSDAWEKVKEEIQEVEAEFPDSHTKQNKNLHSELGDLFFALVNIARFHGIQPEEALHSANRKFYKRFAYIESRVEEANKPFSEFSLDELDQFWNEAKAKGY